MVLTYPQNNKTTKLESLEKRLVNALKMLCRTLKLFFFQRQEFKNNLREAARKKVLLLMAGPLRH